MLSKGGIFLLVQSRWLHIHWNILTSFSHTFLVPNMTNIFHYKSGLKWVTLFPQLHRIWIRHSIISRVGASCHHCYATSPTLHQQRTHLDDHLKTARLSRQQINCAGCSSDKILRENFNSHSLLQLNAFAILVTTTTPWEQVEDCSTYLKKVNLRTSKDPPENMTKTNKNKGASRE